MGPTDYKSASRNIPEEQKSSTSETAAYVPFYDGVGWRLFVVEL
jgi:hypothetical protein